MSIKKNEAILYGVAVMIIVLGLIVSQRAHFWHKVSNAKVNVNGEEKPDSVVYVSRDKDYILLIKQDEGDDILLYLVYPELKQIGIPEKESEILKLPGYMYTYRYPVKAFLSSGTKVAGGGDMAVEKNKIEFNSLNPKGRITISF